MNNIEYKIRKFHGSDEEQLEIIFSDNNRIIVEASAGCGKTKTLASKVAYLLSNNLVPKNKKILALTFGVNAAYKIKKEVIENVSNLAPNIVSQDLEKHIFVTNFHGLSRRILRNYGYLLHENFMYLNEFNVVDDSKSETLTALELGVIYEEANFLSEYSSKIKLNDISYLRDHFNQYVDLILAKFVPQKYITYNAILMLTLKLLHENEQILDFYQKLFSYIIIDEFQDTGLLSWELIKKITTLNTSLLFMGDPLQRIYGFIGAVPDLMQKARIKYNMQIFKISTNYRFKSNPDMLLLDENIRKNSKNEYCDKKAVVPFNLYRTQTEEAEYVINKIKSLLDLHPTCKIAILAQSRTKNLDFILGKLSENNIDYFNGLFNEESPSYKMFHSNVLEMFVRMYSNSKTKTIRKSFLDKVYRQIVTYYESKINDELNALLKLLQAFFKNIYEDKVFLKNEEKYLLISDVLSNNALKQSMEYLNEKIIVTTVHGAKGLEWDYVILPDMEKCSFPNYYSLCSICTEMANKNECTACFRPTGDKKFNDKYFEILSLFYVAVTRAKKQIYFSASLEAFNTSGSRNTKYSCLLSLSGIRLKSDEID